MHHNPAGRRSPRSPAALADSSTTEVTINASLPAAFNTVVGTVAVFAAGQPRQIRWRSERLLYGVFRLRPWT